MRNKKFQLNIYQPNDIAAMEAHLEKMARRGWQLEGMNNWGWRFRRAEPAETRYTVTCFPDASVYDSAPTLGQETYADFCRAAGWEFVSAYGPMQIFRALRPDAAPIETDEGEKLRAVHRSICRTWLPGYGVLLAVWLLNILIRLPEIFRRPLDFLSSSQQMASFALMVGLVAYLAVFMLEYLVWYLRSRRAVAEGGACKAPHTRGRLWAGGVLLVLCAVSLLATFADATSTGRVLSLVYVFGGMVLIMALAQWLLSWAKRRGLSRRAVRWTSIVGAVVLALIYTAGILPMAFGLTRSGLMEEDRVAYVYTGKYGEQNVYRDPIPLTLEDLGYTVTQADHCTYIMEGERSPCWASGRAFSGPCWGRTASCRSWSTPCWRSPGPGCGTGWWRAGQRTAPWRRSRTTAGGRTGCSAPWRRLERRENGSSWSMVTGLTSSPPARRAVLRRISS